MPGHITTHILQRRGIDVQIGLHTGKCAGTVLGTLRRFYCVYGDTVNVTARLRFKCLYVYVYVHVYACAYVYVYVYVCVCA